MRKNFQFHIDLCVELGIVAPGPLMHVNIATCPRDENSDCTAFYHLLIYLLRTEHSVWVITAANH